MQENVSMSLKINSLAENENSMMNLNGLLDRIWSRKDTLVFAVGGSPCIRAVYYKAMENEKLNQFSYCSLTKIDYTLGRAEKKIKDKLEQIIKIKKKAKIFIYLSCMEIITAIDLEKIIEEIEKEEKETQIFILKRGPMVKRHFSSKDYLEKIMKEFEEEEKELVESFEEPIFAGEIEIVINSLEYTENKKCLIQPGGCLSCIKRGRYELNKNNLYATSFNDLDLTFGLEKKFINESKEIFSNEENIIFFETLLPQIVGFNGDLIKEFFNVKEIKSLILLSNNGEEGFLLLEKAYRFILETDLDKLKKSNKTLICGYSTLLDFQKEILWSDIDSREKYIIKLDKEKPENLLVTNLEGLIFAKVYQELLKIPYKIFNLTKIPSFLLTLNGSKKIFFIGDPIQILAYKEILSKNFHNLDILLGFYYPNIKLGKTIEEFFAVNNINRYEKIEDFINCIDENTILISDKQIYNFLKNEKRKVYDFIEIPYQWISGNKIFLNEI